MKRLPNLPLFQVLLNTDDRDQYVNNISKAPIEIRVQQLTADIGVNNINLLLYQVQDPTESQRKLPENVVCCELIIRS